MRAIALFASLCLASVATALTVKQQTSYTTDDAVSARETVFILSFELDKEDESLFAYVDGKVVPVSVMDEKYQVSWSLPIDSAKVGDHLVNFYDEAGYKSLLTYLDGEGEEPVAKVTMTVPHKGTYKGKTAVPPSWFAMSMALMMFIGAKSLRNTAEGSM